MSTYNVVTNYYCPHHPDDNCDCRKPKHKMILRAPLDSDIDLSQAYVIGDAEMDVELANRAGCKVGIRVGQPGYRDDWVTASFRDALSWVVQQTKEFQNC